MPTSPSISISKRNHPAQNCRTRLSERHCCYAQETGSPLSESDQGDIDLFSNGIATMLGSLAASCPVGREKSETCRASVTRMECEALAVAIRSDDTELIVTDLLQGCPGFLDCE